MPFGKKKKKNGRRRFRTEFKANNKQINNKQRNEQQIRSEKMSYASIAAKDEHLWERNKKRHALLAVISKRMAGRHIAAAFRKLSRPLRVVTELRRREAMRLVQRAYEAWKRTIAVQKKTIMIFFRDNRPWKGWYRSIATVENDHVFNHSYMPRCIGAHTIHEKCRHGLWRKHPFYGTYEYDCYEQSFILETRAQRKHCLHAVALVLQRCWKRYSKWKRERAMPKYYAMRPRLAALYVKKKTVSQVFGRFGIDEYLLEHVMAYVGEGIWHTESSHWHVLRNSLSDYYSSSDLPHDWWDRHHVKRLSEEENASFVRFPNDDNLLPAKALLPHNGHRKYVVLFNPKTYEKSIWLVQKQSSMGTLIGDQWVRMACPRCACVKWPRTCLCRTCYPTVRVTKVDKKPLPLQTNVLLSVGVWEGGRSRSLQQYYNNLDTSFENCIWLPREEKDYWYIEDGSMRRDKTKECAESTALCQKRLERNFDECIRLGIFSPTR